MKTANEIRREKGQAVQVVLTHEEHRALKAACAARGEKVSQVVRTLIKDWMESV